MRLPSEGGPQRGAHAELVLLVRIFGGNLEDDVQEPVSGRPVKTSAGDGGSRHRDTSTQAPPVPNLCLPER